MNTRTIELCFVRSLLVCLLVACSAGQLQAWNPLDLLPTSTASEQVGSRAWWKKHKNEAEFVPGEGFRVEGVAGFFDDQGRPITAQVSKVVKEGESKGLLNDARVVESVDEIKSQFGLGANQSIANESYAAGEEAFRKKEYKRAIKAFDEAIQRATDPQVRQDSLFLKAESHFFADEYPDAIETYELLLKDYANSPHLDKCVRRMFSIARYWEEHNEYEPHYPVTPNLFDEKRPWFDTVGNAVKVYEEIRLNDPTGPLADDALMATGHSYYNRARYYDADYQFKLLREEYPRSDHQFAAHIYGLQCKLKIYQGPNYDGAPLAEAKKLVKQLKQQFSGDLSQEERSQLLEIEARLQQALAERDYVLAKYYDETEHYESARYYYSQLAREYPNTEVARKATERFEAIKDEPDHPETRVGWFLDMFPENSERKTLQQVPLLEEATNP